MSEHKEEIIIIKKKGGHHGHHGGAWKVAYADFVTAMMALFIVLWLLSSSEEVQKAVGGYFQDPTGNGRQTGSTMHGSGDGLTLKETDMSKLKEKLEAALQASPQFKKMSNNITIMVTGEGLRIELMESEKGVFFESGSPKPSKVGHDLIAMLASELGKLPNNLFIEGHTDAKPFSSETGYSNWELSADRANAARRLMQENGTRPDQVKQVRGFADQRLKNPKDPINPNNRRVSVIVQHRDPPPASDDGKKKEGGGHNEKKTDSYGEKKADGHDEPKASGHGEKKAESSGHGDAGHGEAKKSGGH